MFGSVHRQVRVPQEIRRLPLSGAVEGDPDADGGEYLLFSKSKGRLQYAPRSAPLFVLPHLHQ